MSLIFDKTVKLAQEKGFIKKRTSQRIDSTKIIAHVNRIATTDLLFRAVKCLTEEIEKRKGSTSSGCSPVNPCLKAVQMHQAYLKYVSVLIKYTLLKLHTLPDTLY